MSTYQTQVYCNECNVKDSAAVLRVVLVAYQSSLFFNVASDRGGTGESVLFLEPGENRWPQAVETNWFEKEYQKEIPEAWFNGGDLTDDESVKYDDALYEAYGTRGDEGFVQMLLALVPYLSGPLTVQAIVYDAARGGPVDACEWHVTPGATTVEINRFRHSPDYVRELR